MDPNAKEKKRKRKEETTEIIANVLERKSNASGFINPPKKNKKFEELTHSRSIATPETRDDRLEAIYDMTETPMYITERIREPEYESGTESIDFGDSDDDTEATRPNLWKETPQPNTFWRDGGLQRPDED